MKEWWKKYKKQIAIGVVSSIAATIIMKLIGWIMEAGPQAGSSIISKLINQVYYSASRISALSIISLLVSLFCAALLVLSVYVLVFSTKTLRESSLRLKIKETSDEFRRIDKLTDKQKVEAAKLIIKYNKLTNKKESDLREKVKNLKISSGCLVFSCILFVLITIFYYYVPLQMKNNFENSVTQIAPFIEEREVLELESKWASMKTSVDYQEILEFIESVKDANNIER